MDKIKPDPDGDDSILLQTDVSPLGKAHSPTLPEWGYIAVPNTVIRGNKPMVLRHFWWSTSAKVG
ncbi:MAG: hypothetical protein R2828_30085 [Saprospiraceae bacterium]